MPRCRSTWASRRPPTAKGVLQDIHWSTGLVGSFPTYTVGNVMSAQFMAAAQRDYRDSTTTWPPAATRRCSAG